MNVKNIDGPTIIPLDALVLNGTLTGYQTFEEDYIRDYGAKPNDVQGKYINSAGTFWLLGEVEYNGGTVDEITGSLYFDKDKVHPIGDWKVDLTSTGLAKAGDFTITDTSIFGKVINGSFVGVTTDPTTFEGVVVAPLTSRTIIAPAYGSYEQHSGEITFKSTIRSKTVSGEGTILSNGNASGDIIMEGKKVGTWSLNDL
jgi:hypothetical protein